MFENRLKDLREERELKAVDIAKKINVAKSTYSEWENGKVSIPTRRIIELADFYKVNIDYMMGISNNKVFIDSKTKINLKDIGLRLKKIRKENNLSLRELGDKLNSSFSSLASYERGEKLITSDTLISFCTLFKCSIDYILDRKK